MALRVGSRVLGEGAVSAGSYEIATAVDDRICSELELTVAAQLGDTSGQDRVALGACGEHLRNFAF